MNSQTSPHVAKDPTVETDRITHEPGKSYDVIAKVELLCVASNGERSSISAAVGSPYKSLGGFWRTPIRFRGFADSTPEIYGEDSLQSLAFALEKIHKELSLIIQRGGRLLDKEGAEISLESYFKSK